VILRNGRLSTESCPPSVYVQPAGPCETSCRNRILKTCCEPCWPLLKCSCVAAFGCSVTPSAPLRAKPGRELRYTTQLTIARPQQARLVLTLRRHVTPPARESFHAVTSSLYARLLLPPCARATPGVRRQFGSDAAKRDLSHQPPSVRSARRTFARVTEWDTGGRDSGPGALPSRNRQMRFTAVPTRALPVDMRFTVDEEENGILDGETDGNTALEAYGLPRSNGRGGHRCDLQNFPVWSSSGAIGIGPSVALHPQDTSRSGPRSRASISAPLARPN